MSMTLKDFLNKYGEDSTSNFQLLKWAKDLDIKPFKVVMRNELYKLKKTKKNYIIANYQTSNEKGIHWVAMYRSSQQNFYFDPYGITLFKEAEEFLVKGIYSTFQIQPSGSKMCGQLCLFLLFKLSKGFDFFDIILEMSEAPALLND